MTNDYRAMCAELVDDLEMSDWPSKLKEAFRADIARARALLAEPVAERPDALHPFVVRHYTDDERPSIKGNGFDGLEIGEDRQEAEEFITWINEHIRPTPQPVAEGPTDEELLRIAATAIAPYEISGITPGEYEPETECAVEAYGSELITYARTALARWGHPTPQPEGGDIHYAWELHDAEGDWQAGGSAITLESVRREGNHYLQTYSQNGPHTLIIQRVSTIEEVTNG